MSTRVCPACGTLHDRADLAGCCSRGCLRFHHRRSAPPVKRRVKPSPLARELIAAIQATPLPSLPPPPAVDMIVCDICQKPAPDWATYPMGAVNVCCTCLPAWKARKLARDDRARPDGPSMGGGQRVIRKTGGLS